MTIKAFMTLLMALILLCQCARLQVKENTCIKARPLFPIVIVEEKEEYWILNKENGIKLKEREKLLFAYIAYLEDCLDNSASH